ncbi:hypothetical protein ILYODFUR_035279, partial [Ilyodon furcidens]
MNIETLKTIGTVSLGVTLVVVAVGTCLRPHIVLSVTVLLDRQSDDASRSRKIQKLITKTINQLGSLASLGSDSHNNQQMCFISVFQKKVLNLLMELRDQHKRTQPISSAVHVERMVTIEDLEREKERLCDPKAFDAL